MIRLWVTGGLLVLLTYGALSAHQPGAFIIGDATHINIFVAFLAASAVVYLLAVAAIRNPTGRRRAVWLVLAVAAVMRVGPVLAPPFLSSDVFRYVWDGRVQAAGINPYRFVPADPALAGLRDEAVYPNINRADYAPTIYPPLAQVIFAAVGETGGGVESMKLAMLGFDALAIFCLLRLLALAGLPAERILIYAWNPLPVWAFAGNGHVDAVVVALVAAALLLRAKSRDSWAGVALGGAMLVKFLPAIIAPALWRRKGGWSLALACAATIVVLYLPYLPVGTKVFGFLGGYRGEEGLDSGSGFWLVAWLERLAPLPAAAGTIYTVVALIVLACAAAWIALVRQPNDPVALGSAAGVLMALVTVAISPHYPWYFAWLAVPAVLAPYRALTWLAVSPVVLYLDIHDDRVIWPSVIYVPAILLAIADWRWRPRLLQPLEGRL
jgi:alpha-1,6-mannosyltransferase